MEQARFAMSQDTREGQNQAIGLFRQVVSDYPNYADAWGLLALTYASTSHYRQSSEAEVLRTRAVSAARRAQAIDAGNPMAHSGLALARPIVGNWSPIGAALGQSAKHKPQTYEVAFSLGKFLACVGRNRDALHFESLLGPSQPIPSNYYNRALLLWSLGQDEELDNLLSEAARIFPTHYAIWFARFYMSMLSGRPEQALALAADTTNRPTNIDPAEVDSVVRVARAIQSRAQGEEESVTSEWMGKAHKGAGYAENAVQFMAAIGKIDEAFTVLRAYFFSEGFDCGEVRFSSSQGTYTPHNDRLTAWLFNPAMVPVRSDDRFAAVVNRLGFIRYWKNAGAVPDYLSRPG
jgi:tetratricopeptide (TPR) repeat protein